MAYVTEQRKLLYDFFSSHPHESFCVKDIYSALSEYGISMSAIYRNLASMKKDGAVCASADGEGRDTYYRFVQNTVCLDTIHMKCTSCGKTFHMTARASEKMRAQLRVLEGFSINKDKTVLYGTCKACSFKI